MDCKARLCLAISPPYQRRVWVDCKNSRGTTPLLKKEKPESFSFLSSGGRTDCATLVFNLSRLGIVCASAPLRSLLGLSEPTVLASPPMLNF